ncbi:MAG TPA: bifunctional demethylmenaquinone methyltransferase/2-methoxy-6-polyprenyl-1,4-benzoquinol methylase UbiE [Alphaproteobacteria bacterium]|nr:bifunctional demethylmenaquinone methyltransferase/2-methoxy-6-polyprenyl-1,4-benzoquinol methylase UbiE [Alphaproteobacteria bacterium]HAJ48342.1 bifunctional demethylmenaquinone methyltransferase/2-methoxy-6-polyprenyl-1,4-benzoquinol methylase UbiE [Alphaproteobacteria bacterium]
MAHDHTDPPGGKTASFGFRDVPAADKQKLVGRVFQSVASRYDVMNDAMSLGVHRLWKQAFVEWLAPGPDTALIDVAGGTGDIAFRFLDRIVPQGGTGSVAVCDINPAMLSEGVKRAGMRQDRDRLSFVCGDAQALPFRASQFDAYTIAFGIRNVTDIAAALVEAHRVLRRGGRLMVLEFSKVDVPGLAEAYDAWSFNVIPALGNILTQDREAYQYLVESIRRFPPQAQFARMIEAAGFGQVKFRNLTGGIVAMHSGWKL